LELRGQGLNNTEIAKQLGYKSVTSVTNLLYEAGRRGWFLTPDVEDHLVYLTSHKIVRNIDKQLEGKDLTPQQQEMTIVAAKGRGLFRNYEGGKSEGAAPSLILGVKIEVVDPRSVLPTVDKSVKSGNYRNRPKRQVSRPTWRGNLLRVSNRRPWSVSEDLQWASSWVCKQWRDESLYWELEVRTERTSVGSQRLGELVLKGSLNGELMLSIHETDWDTQGD